MGDIGSEISPHGLELTHSSDIIQDKQRSHLLPIISMDWFTLDNDPTSTQ